MGAFIRKVAVFFFLQNSSWGRGLKLQKLRNLRKKKKCTSFVARVLLQSHPRFVDKKIISTVKAYTGGRILLAVAIY